MGFQAMKMWKNFKCILLSKRSQSEKATHYTISIIWHSGKGKTLKTIKVLMISWDREVGWRDELVEHKLFLGHWK